jgi:chorismate mutase
VTGSACDPVIQQHRAQIATNDLTILRALNARIDLVKRLKDYKATQGLDFLDAAQEERVLAELGQANAGPISDAGLREIYGFILDWTKREVARL